MSADIWKLSWPPEKRLTRHIQSKEEIEQEGYVTIALIGNEKEMQTER